MPRTTTETTFTLTESELKRLLQLALDDMRERMIDTFTEGMSETIAAVVRENVDLETASKSSSKSSAKSSAKSSSKTSKAPKASSKKTKIARSSTMTVSKKRGRKATPVDEQEEPDYDSIKEISKLKTTALMKGYILAKDLPMPDHPTRTTLLAVLQPHFAEMRGELSGKSDEDQPVLKWSKTRCNEFIKKNDLQNVPKKGDGSGKNGSVVVGDLRKAILEYQDGLTTAAPKRSSKSGKSSRSSSRSSRSSKGHRRSKSSIRPRSSSEEEKPAKTFQISENEHGILVDEEGHVFEKEHKTVVGVFDETNPRKVRRLTAKEAKAMDKGIPLYHVAVKARLIGRTATEGELDSMAKGGLLFPLPSAEESSEYDMYDDEPEGISQAEDDDAEDDISEAEDEGADSDAEADDGDEVEMGDDGEVSDSEDVYDQTEGAIAKAIERDETPEITKGDYQSFMRVVNKKGTKIGDLEAIAKQATLSVDEVRAIQENFAKYSKQFGPSKKSRYSSAETAKRQPKKMKSRRK